MRNLPLPDAARALDEIIEALRPGRTRPGHTLSDEERNIIRELYAQYDNRQGRPHISLEARNLTDAVRRAIHDSYAHVQQGGRLSDLREILKLAAPRCPFCGITGVTDLDHHLPRSEYKALSVYSRNLVPSCHECNNKKRARAGENPEEHIVHAYFDRLPNERFLVADASITNGGLLFRFSIAQTPGLSRELFVRLRWQFERLDLQERYKPEINEFLGAQVEALILAYGATRDADGVVSYLEKTADRMADNHHLNDWRAAILSALATNREFCDGGFIVALGLNIPVPGG